MRLLKGYMVAVAEVVGATAGLWLLQRPLELDKAHTGLVYLLVVASTAALAGRGPALSAAFLAFIAWDFFFLPPVFTIVLNDPRDWFLLFVFLIIALLVGTMTGQIRARQEEAQARSRENAALYASSITVGRYSDPHDALPTLLAQIVKGTHASGAAVVVPCVSPAPDPMLEEMAASGGPQIDPATGSPKHAVPVVTASVGAVARASSASGQRIAAFVAAQVKAVGLAAPQDASADDEAWPVSVGARQVTGVEPTFADVWLPLIYGTHAFGVLYVAVDDGPLDSVRQRLLVAFASHVAANLERARLLEEARSAARNQEAERLKSVLFSSLSHNLKTPLASLSATVSSLRATDVEIDAATMTESIELMAEDLSRLTDHIDNLLSLAQLESGAWQPQREWVEANEVFTIALRLLSAHDRARIRRDASQGSVLVHVDVTQMAQAVRHIVENALMYSPPDCPVDIRVTADAERIRLVVQDHGPGIEAEEVERIFRKFYRGESARRSASRGTGLGLAICKEIVDAHHGTVTVEAAGPGARLAINLPAERPPEVEIEE